MPGIEPGAFHMQSERSTTEPHPLYGISDKTRCWHNYLDKHIIYSFYEFVNFSRLTEYITKGPVAQWTRRLTTNQEIAGSSPARINTFYHEIIILNVKRNVVLRRSTP